MEIQEKAERWFEKGKRGEKDYAMIVRSNDTWYYTSRKNVEQISSLLIIKAENDKYECFYEWDGEGTMNEKDFSIVIKDDQKLMLMDSQEGIFAFGLSEADDKATDFVIMFVAGGISTTITASKDGDQIDIRYCMLSSSKDILLEIVKHSIYTLSDEKSKEINADEERGDFNEVSD